jgi:hypothetical protein
MKRGRKLALFALLTSGVSVLGGCATTGRSVGAGAAAGGIAGAGVGAIADPGRHGENRFRNVVIGTAIGAAVGAGAGYAMDRFTHDEREDAAKGAKAQAEKEAETHAAQSTGMEPRLLPARTEARWIPDQVRGSTFVPGHFEYIIIEGARWETGK